MFTMLTVCLLAQANPPITSTKDRLAFLELPTSSQSKHLGLFIRPVKPANSTGGGPVMSNGIDEKFVPVGGPKAFQIAFGADVDGDLNDELIVLRERVSDGGYQLSIHLPPLLSGDDASKPSGRSKMQTIGSRPQFGRIMVANGIDVDGDFVDEWMMIRQTDNGEQRLEVMRLPDAKGLCGPPIGSYLGLGTVSVDRIVDIAAVDIDGDGREEIAVLRDLEPGKQSISILPPPQVVGDIPPQPFGSVEHIYTFEPFLGIDGVDFGSDGIDEIYARRPINSYFEDGSIDIGNPNPLEPTLVGMEFLALPLPPAKFFSPLFTTMSRMLVSKDEAESFRAVAMLRGPSSKPGATAYSFESIANGAFHGTLKVVSSDGGYVGNTTTTELGPFDDFDVSTDGTSITLDLPGANHALHGTRDAASGKVTLDSNAVELHGVGSGTEKVTLQIHELTTATLGKHAMITGTFSAKLEKNDGTKLSGDGTLSFVRAKD